MDREEPKKEEKRNNEEKDVGLIFLHLVIIIYYKSLRDFVY
jgi:hypothetical protein